MKIRGGPAAVIGDKAHRSTVQFKLNGKGGWRETRKPEDGRLDRGILMAKANPVHNGRGFFVLSLEMVSGKAFVMFPNPENERR